MEHNIIYHTDKEDIKVYGKLSTVENDLVDKGFFKCNRWYLVNMRHVRGLKDLYVDVAGEKLLISRIRKDINVSRKFIFLSTIVYVTNINCRINFL